VYKLEEIWKREKVRERARERKKGEHGREGKGSIPSFGSQLSCCYLYL